MTDSVHIRPINESIAAMRNFNDHLEQVFQRLDILEKGQKLDRKGRDMDTNDFEKLEAKVRRIDENLFAHKCKVENMDEKLTARVNDLDARMKVSPGGDLGAQMLEIIEDSGTVNEALQSLARESARDVLGDHEVDGENIKNLSDYVELAIDNTDISDKIDFHALCANQFDLDDWRQCLGIDDINEKIDKLVRIIATAKLLIERIGDTDV